MKKSYKVLLILLVCLLLVTGCKKKKKTEPEPTPDVTPVSDFKETYPEITSLSEYVLRLDYFGLIAYDRGYCTEDRKDKDIPDLCELKLSDLKTLLTDLDLSILDEYKGKKCDATKIAFYINTVTSTKENPVLAHMLDYGCVPLDEIPKPKVNQKPEE